MLKSLVLILLTVFLFTSCIGSKQQEVAIAKKEYPSWYINPTKNSYLYLYGVGKGYDIDEASKNALIDLSSKLSISISSEQTSLKKSYFKYREYVEKEFQETISSKTETLNFPNYEVDKTEKMSYKELIVSVKVEREKLVNLLKSEINQTIKNYYSDENSIKNEDALTQYINYKNSFEKLFSKVNKVEILKNLDDDFSDKEYKTLLDNSYDKINYNKSKISFYINEDKQILVNKLKESLTSLGFKIAEFKNATHDIEVESIINRKNPQGFYIVDNNSSIKIYYKESLILSKNFYSKGVSSNSYKDALNDSFEKIEFQDLKELF